MALSGRPIWSSGLPSPGSVTAMDDDALPLIESERLVLRPALAADADALLQILAEPDVLGWWGHHDASRVREDLPGSYVVVVEGTVAGWLHVHEEREADYPSVSFDILVTTRLRGGGYGREALRAAIRHYVARGHHRFTIDPAAANERAIRAYTAIGFKPVGVLRRYERAPDGRWRDGLLMDLLADELVE
jgi:aminoglycoside 6'-N-acetyltransferase